MVARYWSLDGADLFNAGRHCPALTIDRLSALNRARTATWLPPPRDSRSKTFSPTPVHVVRPPTSDLRHPTSTSYFLLSPSLPRSHRKVIRFHHCDPRRAILPSHHRCIIPGPERRKNRRLP